MTAIPRHRSELALATLFSLLLLVFSVTTPSTANTLPPLTPILLGDINPGVMPLSSEPAHFTVVDDTIFFSALDENYGLALWASDGTAAGTRLVRDLHPANDAYSRSGEIRAMVAFGSGVLFVNDDGLHGFELWVSDGTAAGTRLVADLNPGPDSAFDANDLLLLVADDRAFFAADDGVHGSELWVSDGTAAGTRLVVELAPGSAPGLTNDTVGLTLGSQLYFMVKGATHGAELWVSDGTTVGTRLVKVVNPEPSLSNLSRFGALGSTVYFTADDGIHGYELWRTDGTPAGTTLVADIYPGQPGSYPWSLTALGSSIYMLANDGVHGRQLWRSSGADGATVMVAQLGDSPQGLVLPQLTLAGERLYLSDEFSGVRVWASDGTATGTVLVRSFPVGTVTFGRAGAAALIGYSSYRDDAYRLDTGLWVSDGTAAGTAQIAAVSNIAEISAFGERAVLRATVKEVGAEPWISDGTTAGTYLIKDINQRGADAGVACLTRSGDRLYFSADDGVHGPELWVSDGTAAGTLLLADLVPGSRGSAPCDFVSFAGTLTFAADGRLWRSDGTAAGTVAIIGPDHLGGSAVRSGVTVVGDRAFFSAGPRNDELWVLEHDLQTARLVEDFDLIGKHGPVPLDPRYVIGGRLVSSTVSYDGSDYQPIWSSDGTAEGTQRIDFGTIIGVAGERVLYHAASYYSANYNDLMATDGTLDGAVRLLSDLPSRLSRSVSADGWAFFIVGQETYSLMVSDGTALGTRVLMEPGRQVTEMATAQGRLFFVQADSKSGQYTDQLWVADGPEAATHLVHSFGPRPWDSGIQKLTIVDDVLYFANGDAAAGSELWASDGTAAGTLRCLDLNPGTPSSSPLGIGQAAALDGRLIFVADDGVHGRELWSIAAGGCGSRTYLPLVLQP